MLCVSYVAIESIYVYDYLGKQNNMMANMMILWFISSEVTVVAHDPEVRKFIDPLIQNCGRFLVVSFSLFCPLLLLV